MINVIAEARYIRGGDGLTESIRLIEVGGRDDPYHCQVNYNNEVYSDFITCSTHSSLELAEAGFKLLCSYRERKGWHRISPLELLAEVADDPT